MAVVDERASERVRSAGGCVWRLSDVFCGLRDLLMVWCVLCVLCVLCERCVLCASVVCRCGDRDRGKT